MLAIDGKWLWDFWLYPQGDLWHIYYLQADKGLTNPDLRHWHVSQGHATSRDVHNWEVIGTCLEPAPHPAWDDCTTWTGSVVRDDAGLWHLFYTGTCTSERGLKQRIGHATSTDGHRWERVDNGLALDLDPALYEEHTPGHWHDRALRDPWVIEDPDGEGWLMYFTARVPGHIEANEAGAIGLARSKDLTHWRLEPPVFTGLFGQLEVPQVFEHQGRWYCLFCTAPEHWSRQYSESASQAPVGGTHYLMANHPLGPWHIAPGLFLDGTKPIRRYAGKIISHEEALLFISFLHDTPDHQFIGRIDDPVQVKVDGQGLLRLAG
jgi:beta-fructofuranosidase